MTHTTTYYRAGWLIDGSGRPAVQNRLIAVSGDRIRRITDGKRPPDESESKIVDLSDCTILPALVDSHVHLVMSGTTDPIKRKRQLASTYGQRRDVISRHLRWHLKSGVFAIRDGGDHNGDTLRYKTASPAVSERRVTITAPGRARHAPGRYGKLIGIPVAAGQTLAQSAFGAGSRRDHLKLVNSGLNSLTQFGVQTPPQFDADQLAAVVAAAKRCGQPTMVHANGYLPVKLAVDAGCDSIEHGFFMGRENMRRMADNGVVWVPTAVTMKAYRDYLTRQGVQSDASFAEVSGKNLQHQLSQIDAARRLGVTLAVGTDAGSTGVHHGRAVRTEIQLFVAAGFSVEEAIRCASRIGARLMGLPDRGRIAPGMRADFLAVRAPVNSLPAALGDIVCHVAQGKRIRVADA